MQDLNLTLLQTPLLWHDPAGNREVLGDLITQEAAGSDLLVLPGDLYHGLHHGSGTGG